MPADQPAVEPSDLLDILDQLVDAFARAQRGPLWSSELDNGARHVRAAVVAVRAHVDRVRRLQVPDGPQG